jgi:hypothetical protein
MITFSKYYTLLKEDLQSSLNSAKNILQNNNAGDPENIQHIVYNLEDIYNTVQFDDDQNKQANKDSNIPALAFWFIADPNFNRIKEDYRQYVNTRSLYQKNFLINSVENLKKEISNRKLFKPTEEKLSLIKQTFVKVAETIHSQYQPVTKETDKKFVSGEMNDDVVYEDDAIVVYKADSKGKCIKYGAGSTLCISVKGGGNYYWSYRMGNMRNDGLGMTTYFVYWKDGSNRILFDVLGDEDGPANKYSWNPITPNTDRDVKIMDLLIKYPELEEALVNNVFQFIPYGEKEQRYQYISENVRYLLDPELKTLEDYEMFIEDYEESDALKYSGWVEVANKLGEPQAAYLVKKYAGLGNLVDLETQKRFLTPKDREWYLDIIAEYEPYEIIEYCELVNGEHIPERLIRAIIKDGSYYNEFLRKVVGVEYDTSESLVNILPNYFIKHGVWPSHTYMDSDEMINAFMDFFMGRNITTELLNYILTHVNPQDRADIPSVLIEYYSKNNIPIPKPLYKSIVSDPHIAFKFRRRWVKNKKTPPPGILLKTILKRPLTALMYAKDLKWAGEPIPDEVENAILKDPSTAYTYINNISRNFEKYSNDFLVWLFTNNNNGIEFAREYDGYGIFEKNWGKKSYEDVRKAILRNIMNNPKKVAYILKWAESYERRQCPKFFNILDDLAEGYNESFKYSQLDTIIELSKYNK